MSGQLQGCAKLMVQILETPRHWQQPFQDTSDQEENTTPEWKRAILSPEGLPEKKEIGDSIKERKKLIAKIMGVTMHKEAERGSIITLMLNNAIAYFLKDDSKLLQMQASGPDSWKPSKQKKTVLRGIHENDINLASSFIPKSSSVSPSSAHRYTTWHPLDGSWL
ncbi:hypothetical protein chiPu_0006656 [Chiloscyllium punctatum]|uniref:Uncharacterized protein n=1 Tax=Chiloscyllium punctatum TaxID=137246 RepID=A0A401SCT2_CHIPU|nr:hypothetical protein [Chiloscyllium punctatum]